MAAASPSTRGRTASCAEREAAWWCSSRWTLPSPTTIGSCRRPRHRRQSRRWPHGRTRPAKTRSIGCSGRLRERRGSPGEVSYVEPHGTGTPPVIRSRGRARPRVRGAAGRGPARVGSVKTNIGHLEAAAGIAGLIKAALSLDRGEIPPSLNFEQPNPQIPLNGSGSGSRPPVSRGPRCRRGLQGSAPSASVGPTATWWSRRRRRRAPRHGTWTPNRRVRIRDRFPSFSPPRAPRRSARGPHG